MDMKIGYTDQQIEKSRVLRKPIITLVIDGRYCGEDLSVIQETQIDDQLLQIIKEMVKEPVDPKIAATDAVFAEKEEKEQQAWEQIAKSVGQSVANKLF